MEKLLNGHTRIYLGAWKSFCQTSFIFGIFTRSKKQKGSSKCGLERHWIISNFLMLRGMPSSSNYYSSDESFDLRHEALKCDCGLRAAIRVTESDKPSKGRLYFICEKRNCQFWRWCTPKSVTMVERLRNERMLDQNQNMETVGLKMKNQMLEQSNAFMKQLVVGLFTICIVMSVVLLFK